MWIVTASQTRLLTSQIGKQLAVFNGSIPLYSPGLSKDMDPAAHPLHLAKDYRSDELREQLRLALQTRAARASGERYASDGGRLPYRSLEREAIRLKRPPAEAVAGDVASPPRPHGIEGASPRRFRWSAMEPARAFLRRGARAMRVFAFRGRAPSTVETDDLRARLGRLERENDELRRACKKLERSARSSGRAREKVLRENERQAEELADARKRIEVLEAEAAAGSALPDTWDRLVAWCDTSLAGKLMLPRAVRRDLPRAHYRDAREAASGLRWLAEEYREGRISGRGDDLRGSLPRGSNISNERCGSHSFDFDWQGQARKVEWHLRRGNSHDPRRCLRIYYFWDPDLQRVVVASMPSHRVTSD